MTYSELHKILDDENYKITLGEFSNIVYKLKSDCWNEYYKEYEKTDAKNFDLAFYSGEMNAFQIVLDLILHIV